MSGQRRYGTKKSLTGPGTPAQQQQQQQQARVPLLSGERKYTKVPNTSYDEGGGGGASLEREPLLLGGARGPGDRGASNGGSSSSSSIRGRRPVVGAAFASGSSRRDNSKKMTSLLVLSYMIGSGVLNAPQVFKESGVGAATFLYIVAALAVLLGIVVLVDASEKVFPRGFPFETSGGDGGTTGASPPTHPQRAPLSSSSAPSSLSSSTSSAFVGAGKFDGGEEGDNDALMLLEDLEFALLAKETLGPYGALCVDAFIVVGNFGDICSYVILVGSLTGSLLSEWVGVSASDAWWASFSFVTPVMVLLFVFPPCLIRHFSNLRWLSALSLGGIISIVFLVAIGGPIYAAQDRAEADDDGDSSLFATVVWWDWTGSIAKLGSVVFAMSCAPAVLHAYTSMTPRSPRAWRPVALWSVGIGICLCYAIGLGGYLSFRDAVNGDILENFTGAVASVFKAAMVLHLIVYIPCELIVMRHSLYALRGGDVMSADFDHVWRVTFALLALIVGSMVGLNAVGIAQGDLFGYILDITGGVAGSVTSFILPALIYLGATSDDGYVFEDPSGGRSRNAGYRRACKALVAFGVVVMIAVPIGVVIAVAGW